MDSKKLNDLVIRAFEPEMVKYFMNDSPLIKLLPPSKPLSLRRKIWLRIKWIVKKVIKRASYT